MSTIAATAELVWGYTMADIDRIAWVAVRKRAFGQKVLIDEEERYNLAWEAIVDCLYSWPYTSGSPEFHDLFRAGLHAVTRADSGYHRHFGIATPSSPPVNFTKFWVTICRSDGTHSDFTDKLCETIALPRALAVLSLDEYEAIVTLAAFNNSATAAAKALGVNYKTFTKRVRKARSAILEVWFEGETPVRSKPNSGPQCRAGHPRAKDGIRTPKGDWRCRRCELRSERLNRTRAGTKAVLDLAPDPEPVLTFAAAPPEEPDALRTAANTCWCGLAFGHDWPHKTEGAPHPRLSAAG